MIFLDIETLDLFSDPHFRGLSRFQQIAALRFGLAVTHDTETGVWREWFPDALPALWQYLAGTELCGWNILDFDLPVIAHNLAQVHNIADGGPGHFGRIVDLFDDIRRETGRWYKLDLIAEVNLGRKKIAHGTQAPEWLLSGDPELVRRAAEYCRDDVALVVELYRILAEGKGIKLPARPERYENEALSYYISRSI